MEVESQRPNLRGREGAMSVLNAAIEALNLAKELSSITPAKAIFGSVSVTLSMIRDAMINQMDYVELGLACADVCTALDRGLNGKRLNDLNNPAREAINQLTTVVAEIERNIIRQGERSVISRRLYAKNDKEKVAAWRLDLDKILQVFDKTLTINTDPAASTISHDFANTHTIVPGIQNDAVNTVSDSHRNVLKSPKDTSDRNRFAHASAPGDSPPPLPRSTHGTVSDIRRDIRAIVSEVGRDITATHIAIVSDMHRTMAKVQEGSGSGGTNPLIQTSTLGESSPPAPRACFGRGELIEKIVGLAENLTPIALIGAGGIGKTSIALTVLHHDRIRQRFGDNRRFIRCDRFIASCAHFLSRISKVTGAGIENPKDLASLRPYLSSKEVFIVLDNAESILDPQGKDAREIYAVVEELGQFDNVCLCITSRISTTPADCETLEIPTLTIEAARDAFYRIYKNCERSDLVDNILDRLDFHALSITLLATVAHHNKWDVNRLTREWEQRRTIVLQTEHNKSLAATIELSLASAMFLELGPDARELLGVVAFFPQGVNEDNLDWLFPTISNRTIVFDRFCILSLTHRSNGFVTMLAPLREYLSPKNPESSSLLCTTKECYFTRMSVKIDPNNPNFGETRWITSEDVNVEHLLDVFTTIDPNSGHVWSACANFVEHLHWHKNRVTVLQPKIEGLPDDHNSKPECLFQLSSLIYSVGNFPESKRLVFHALKLWRKQGDDNSVAQTLGYLSDINRLMHLPKEGIEQAKEALEIYERLGNTMGQARCLDNLALSLREDGQLDAAEEAVFRAIALLPEKGQEYRMCLFHQTLGKIYRSKGEVEKTIHHFEVALGIASSFNWHDCLFGIHYNLAGTFYNQCRFKDAQTHLERAKLHAVDSAYELGMAMKLQARAWYEEGRFEEAKTEALHAADVYGGLGAAKGVEDCRKLLQKIEGSLVSPGQSALNSQGTKRWYQWLR